MGKRFKIMHKSGSFDYIKADNDKDADEINSRLQRLQDSRIIARFWRLDPAHREKGKPVFKPRKPDEVSKLA